jgi:hypothetical protein
MGGYIATERVARKENRSFGPVAPESEVTALPGLKTSPKMPEPEAGPPVRQIRG